MTTEGMVAAVSVDVDVTIMPGSQRFDPDDDRWRDQVATLHTELGAHVGPMALRRAAPGAGTKGALDAVVLAVGSSGALTAAVACFRSWLARDKTRTLTITWTDGTGAEQRLSVTADNIDRVSFQALAQVVGTRPGDR